MNKFSSLIILCLFAISCQNDAKPPKSDTKGSGSVMYFGEKISADGATPVDSLKALMGSNKEMNCKLEGTVDAVCKKKGCWMEITKTDGSTMRVTFKDYAFFMPKDCEGKTAIMDGIAKLEVTSVADLKEYAKDDGQSQDQINAISTPQEELVFEAKGVILK